jgi:hypothetical protein
MREEMKPSTTQARPSSFVSLLSGWVQQGMESFFATQRILMDVAMRQNANTIKTIRESLANPEHSPVNMLTELAVEGTANFVEAQRILLDLAQKESEIIMNGVKERVAGSNTATAMADLVRRSIDTFVDMQQEFLTIANKQAQGWLHDAKAGNPYNSERMVELAREGMENFVHAQKKFLDVIAEETGKATADKEPTGKMVKKTEMTKLAQESSKAFIDAQKKLLDLASQQMNVNLQMAGRAADMASPLRIPFAKLTGDGVKNFVDAEKALMDTMMKRGKPMMKTEPKMKKTPAKRGRARKPMTKAATV